MVKLNIGKTHNDALLFIHFAEHQHSFHVHCEKFGEEVRYFPFTLAADFLVFFSENKKSHEVDSLTIKRFICLDCQLDSREWTDG